MIFLCKSATKKIVSVFFLYISTANEQRRMKVEKNQTEDLIKSLQITHGKQAVFVNSDCKQCVTPGKRIARKKKGNKEEISLKTLLNS